MTVITNSVNYLLKDKDSHIELKKSKSREGEGREAPRGWVTWVGSKTLYSSLRHYAPPFKHDATKIST